MATMFMLLLGIFWGILKITLFITAIIFLLQLPLTAIRYGIIFSVSRFIDIKDIIVKKRDTLSDDSDIS